MTPLVRAFLAELGRRLGGAQGLASVGGAGRSYALAALLGERDVAVAIVVPSQAVGLRLHGFLRALLGEGKAPLWLPAPDADPYEGLPGHPGILAQRATALSLLAASARPSLLATAESLLYRVPMLGWWRSCLITIEEEQALDRREFRTALWRLGYRQVDQVGEPGEAAFRGGIVDLFSPLENLPTRLELFGDEVDSLRFFDPASQHSLGAVGRPLLVPPLSEAVRDDALLENVKARLAGNGEFGALRLEGLSSVGTYPSLAVEVRQDREFFGTLKEFLPSAQWAFWDPPQVLDQAKSTLEGWRSGFEARHRPPFLDPERLFMGLGELEALLQDPRTVRFSGGAGEGVPTERAPVYPGEPYRLLTHIKDRVAQGYRCLALLQGQGTLDRLAEMALAEDLPLLREAPGGDELPPGFYGALAPAEEGVVFPGLGWMTVTEKEIFGRGRALPEARVQRREAFFTGLRDLKAGDPVVHLEHGVGLYQGIETLVREGLREDYLVLTYQGDSRLLVPVQRMDLIQKYSGPEGYVPPLDRLGGTTWKKTKDKVRRAVKEIAGDLLKLYAQRKTVEGHRFGPDGEWQTEFEAQFPFELTPDQARAVEEVKADMESVKPMDRLVCGDVGFGKTEVALRAAFKAVADGLQVAVLCPTTVLALQHMERFGERFAPFPVRVAMLSRFVQARDQKRVAAAASAGEIDVLIGTHRILSKDVVMPRLGLLVVDEEQRFGVTHKEKIKQLKTKVDVLTLTATPIPRTLQMGLSGILDMSLIQTPPKDRLSIQTSVQPFDPDLVKACIRRELTRGGQVYYVHNKVETIAGAARKIQEWVPEARVTMAHGQMGERALEEVMIAFFHGRYDVLVSTTIIENGVDLPRANTLLVENAHAMGLTQLYQLRGRIGRSDVPAYAYLFTPPGLALKGDAERRLETLREFSELGAGFRVAAVDLELRGAGNLLGAEQSGHMASVGFELYLRMLEEAVSEAKGEAVAPVVRCELNLGLDLAVPVEYMEEMHQRLEFYRKLSLAATEAEVDRVAEELQDRFGPAPDKVLAMLEAVRLRLRAERLGIRSVAARKGALAISFDPSVPWDPARLVRFLSRRPGVHLNPAGSLEMGLAGGESSVQLLGSLLEAVRPSGEAWG